MQFDLGKADKTIDLVLNLFSESAYSKDFPLILANQHFFK